MNRHILFLAFLIFSSFDLFAQQTEYQVIGKVVEAEGQQPIAFATVVIKKLSDSTLLSGGTTEEDGRFSVTVGKQAVMAEVSFLGFEKKVIEDIVFKAGVADIGVISLAENSELLEVVAVRAEKSTTEFKLDKRVFNVGKDISSTGMSALEVLNNVPSVTVDIEGEVSLRGSSGVQILIDGKPSVLADDRSNALGSITADMIESIEVITNPSAKYDAEGTAGILNIVLKKEQKKGLNGSISVNGGIPDNNSVGVSLNRRSEKFNVFSQLGAGYRSSPRETESRSIDRRNNQQLNTDGSYFRNEAFYNVILGTDYFIDPLNVITLSGNFAYEVEDQPSDTRFMLMGESDTASWNRTEVTEADNPKWRFELQYKKNYEDHKDHQLIASVLGNFFGKDQSSAFRNDLVSGQQPLNDQRTETNYKQAEYTFKLDYTKPFNEKWTLETGLQYVTHDVGNEFAVQDLILGEWVQRESFTNDFNFDQNVAAGYFTAAFEDKKWGLKAGLRAEQTNLNTLLANTNQSNEQNYLSLFPSAHSSLKLSNQLSLQVGYSRRIYRPRLWDLNPFFNIRNDFSIRSGNPDLQAEFTDSYEFTAISIWSKLSLNGSIYRRFTDDMIERVFLFEDNVSTQMPMNIGTNLTTGFEVNGKYNPFKWLTLSGDFDYHRFQRRGQFNEQNFDFDGDRWTSRLNTKVRLPLDIDIEITGQYFSAYKNVQGTTSETAQADVGLRKKLLGGKAVVNFSVRDVFASRIRERFTEQPGFRLYTFDQRGRFITLGVSYGFGKGEAMTYSGRRR